MWLRWFLSLERRRNATKKINKHLPSEKFETNHVINVEALVRQGNFLAKTLLPHKIDHYFTKSQHQLAGHVEKSLLLFRWMPHFSVCVDGHRPPQLGTRIHCNILFWKAWQNVGLVCDYFLSDRGLKTIHMEQRESARLRAHTNLHTSKSGADYVSGSQSGGKLPPGGNIPFSGG